MATRQAEIAYDPGARRRARRSGRETGCWVYVPAVQIEAVGLVPGGELPEYRTWATSKGGIMVRLYQTTSATPEAPQGIGQIA